MSERLPGKADHQPWGDDHRDEEREDHRRRGIDRDRRHVGPHQPGNEQHRQQRGDHGQRGDDGRVADFGHGIDRRIDPAATIRHGPVPGDVLDHHDRIVDQDPDREDQREQADPVDREAHDLRSEHGQHDGGRNDDCGYRRLAPADREADQEDDRNGRQAQVKDQLVGLFVGGLAIVAGHRDLHAGGDQAAFQRLDPFDHAFRYGHRIGPGPLGDRQADRRGHRPFALVALTARPAPRAGLVLGRGLNHAGDVLEQHRRATGRTHGQLAQFLGAAQGLPGGDRNRLAAFAHGADREGPVGLADRLDHAAQRHLIGRQPGRIGHHPQRIALAADNEGQPDIVDLGHLGAQLAGQFEQRLVVPLPRRAGFRGQGQDHDRHVADPAHGDLRRGNADRDPADIGPDPFVDPDRGVFRIGADQEPRGDHHPVVLGLGIDVLDPADALDDRFERLADQFDRLGRGQAGRHDRDIDHRHRDLRLFLARDGDRGDQPDDHRGEQHQRGQRRLDRRPGQLARNAQIHRTGPIRVSPATTPESSSIWPASPVGAVWTGTWVALPSFARTVT